jgi:hypothetical protein
LFIQSQIKDSKIFVYLLASTLDSFYSIFVEANKGTDDMKYSTDLPIHTHIRNNLWMLRAANFWFKHSAAMARNVGCAADFIIDTEPKEG